MKLTTEILCCLSHVFCSQPGVGFTSFSKTRSWGGATADILYRVLVK